MSKREGLVYGMSEDEYHGQGEYAEHQFAEVSSTHAKLIASEAGPAKYDFMRRSKVPQEPRVAFDLGTAVHTEVLGAGASIVEYPAEHLTKSGNVSTAAVTVAWAKQQREAGLVPVSADQALAVVAMKEAVLAHPTARKLFEREGRSEVSVFDKYLDVKRRGRFDYLPDEGGIAVDLKTTMDASPAGFKMSVAKFGYHIQRGHYRSILERLGREVEMLFVTVEKTAPYLVAVHQLTDEFAHMGETEALAAVDTYRRCMDSGVWPGYPEGINQLVPPMFSIYDFQDKYEREEMQV